MTTNLTKLQQFLESGDSDTSDCSKSSFSS